MIDENRLIEELRFQINNCEKYGHSDIYVDLEMAKQWLRTFDKPKVDEWIPVKERLPEEQTDYKGIKRSYCSLVTVIGYGVSRIDIDYTVNGIWHLEEANTVLKVIAWQPLPEPYKKG